MIIPYKNRQLDPNRPVYVYRNLHKNCFSIRQRGIIVGHVDSLSLRNCSFIVNERGRQKVIKTHQKNVHAFVKGTLNMDTTNLEEPVYYSPYHFSYFYRSKNAIPVCQAPLVNLRNGRIYI